MIYRSFIEAEAATRSDGRFTSSITSFDFDMDGNNEHLYQSKELNAYFHCSGGMIFELDYMPAKWNYCDTVARRPEIYHDDGAHPYDWYMRRAFIDHFFSPDDGIQDFDAMTFDELGDFVTGMYELEKLDRDHLELTFVRNGCIATQDGSLPARLEKTFAFEEETIQARYTISNMSGQALNSWFGIELNLAFAGSEPKDLAIYKYEKNRKSEIPRGITTHSGVKRLQLQDLHNRTAIVLGSESEFTLWSLPVETSTWSNGTCIRAYQANCLLPRWHLSLAPGEAWRNSLTLNFSVNRKKRTRA